MKVILTLEVEALLGFLFSNLCPLHSVTSALKQLLSVTLHLYQQIYAAMYAVC